MYSEWNQIVPDWLSVRAVEYPGHGGRIAESLTHDSEQIASEIAAAIIEDSRPFILFGHSVGAAMAWRIVSRLDRLGHLHDLKLLALSGRPAPEHLDKKFGRHDLPREAFLAEVHKYSGLPEEIYQNEDLLDFFLPILRNDLHLNENLYRDDPAPVDIPIVAFSGASDADTNKAGSMEAWEKYTTRWQGHVMYSGGHFFLRDRNTLERMISCLCGIVQRVMEEKFSGTTDQALPASSVPEMQR